MVSLRSFFTVFRKVKYDTCQICFGPVRQKSFDHVCNFAETPLQFQVTNLTDRTNSIYFNFRCDKVFWIREITCFIDRYVRGIEILQEDLENKKIQRKFVGHRTEKYSKMSLESAEYIKNLEYGSDFNGIYCLVMETSNNKTYTIGEKLKPTKKIEISNNFTIVGLFGGYKDVVTHIGFYFDSTQKINYARHRELLLVKYKGKKPEIVDQESGIMSLIFELDENLFRYLSGFV